jgi:hypothetical protein
MAEMDMVERVSAAICRAASEDPGGDRYHVARKALKAMRKPTEAMLRSGFSASGLDWADKRSDIDEVWQAMIDAALSDTSSKG